MEYRIAFGWRLFIYIGAPLICALGVWMLFQFIVKVESDGFWMDLIILTLSLSIIFGALYSLIRIHKEKISIRNKKLIHQLAFSKKELDYDQVRGFRIDENYIRLIPKDEMLKPLHISSYLAEKETFINFLFEKFQSLDVIDLENEETEILSDQRFGENEDEINKRFTLAVTSVKWLNRIVLISCLWAWVYPHPYNLVILINLALPLISFGLFIHFKGMIKLDKKQKSLYPSILSAIILPTSAIGIRCLFDYNFLDLTNILIISFCLALSIFTLLFFYSSELKRTNTVGIISSILFYGFIFAYSFSVTSILNVMFDNSPVSTYKAEVFSKHSSENFESIKLTEGWAPFVVKKVKAKISTTFYSRVQTNDTVLVNVREGAFGSSWLIVEEIIISRNNLRYPEYDFKVDSTFYNFD